MTSPAVTEGVRRLLRQFQGLDLGGLAVTPGMLSYQLATAASVPTVTVASSEARAQVKALADFVCDGTDDQIVLQQAHDAIPSGGRINESEGTFFHSGPLTIAKNVTIQATGPRSTVHKVVSGFTGAAVINDPRILTSFGHLAVRGLEIDGVDLGTGVHGINVPTIGSLIYADIQDVWVHDMTGSGIVVNRPTLPTGGIIRGCRVWDCGGDGIYAEESRTLISSCHCLSNLGSQIVYFRQDDGSVVGCNVSGGAKGIHLAGSGGNNNIIALNTVSVTGRGIHVASVNDSLIGFNSIRGCTIAGIEVSTVATTGNYFVHNLFTANTADAVPADFNVAGGNIAHGNVNTSGASVATTRDYVPALLLGG